jgi:hypothetical protein
MQYFVPPVGASTLDLALYPGRPVTHGVVDDPDLDAVEESALDVHPRVEGVVGPSLR